MLVRRVFTCITCYQSLWNRGRADEINNFVWSHRARVAGGNSKVRAGLKPALIFTCGSEGITFSASAFQMIHKRDVRETERQVEPVGSVNGFELQPKHASSQLHPACRLQLAKWHRQSLRGKCACTYMRRRTYDVGGLHSRTAPCSKMEFISRKPLASHIPLNKQMDEKQSPLEGIAPLKLPMGIDYGNLVGCRLSKRLTLDNS